MTEENETPDITLTNKEERVLWNMYFNKGTTHLNSSDDLRPIVQLLFLTPDKKNLNSVGKLHVQLMSKLWKAEKIAEHAKIVLSEAENSINHFKESHKNFKRSIELEEETPTYSGYPIVRDKRLQGFKPVGDQAKQDMIKKEMEDMFSEYLKDDI
jgi:hypothetical protein